MKKTLEGISKLTKTVDWSYLDLYVEKTLQFEDSGHDYGHAKRVLHTALGIAEDYEHIDYDVLVASSLLHDIAFGRDAPVKLHHVFGAKQANKLLPKFDFPGEKLKDVYHVIINHNRAYAPKETIPNTIDELSMEARIMFDADNIDALGTIGLIRIISFSSKQHVPYFISKKDKGDESLYGNINHLIRNSKNLLTEEGRRLARGESSILQEFNKKLVNCNK